MNTDAIESRIRRRRVLAQLSVQKALEDLYVVYPDIKKLETEKRMIASDRTLDKNKRALLVSQKETEIRDYVAKHNIILPTPQYFCKQCQDTGYIVENGRTVRCSCFTKLLLEQNFEGSVADKAQTFFSFDETVFDEQDRAYMRKLKSYCQTYCRSFPHPERRNLIFSGDTGCGKTYLLNCLFHELTKNGFGVVYLTAGRLFEILRSYAFQQDDKLSLLLETQILLIDDFGTEPLFNNITLEYMFMLINERTRQGRAICLSTNLTPDEIKQRYTERISSRLFDQRQSAVFRLPGRDLRLKK